MTVLNYEKVYQSYVVDELSDNQIANQFGVDRTAVVHFRERYGIQSRVHTGEIGEGIVVEELLKAGFVAVNMNGRSKIYPYDILVHGLVKIDVKSANLYAGSWRFQLCNKSELGNVESEHYLRLDNGRMRKQFHKTCDFLIFCGIAEGRHQMFVIPSSEISRTIQTVNINPYTLNKWRKWENRYDLISNLLAKRKDRLIRKYLDEVAASKN